MQDAGELDIVLGNGHFLVVEDLEHGQQPALERQRDVVHQPPVREDGEEEGGKDKFRRQL